MVETGTTQVGKREAREREAGSAWCSSLGLMVEGTYLVYLPVPGHVVFVSDRVI